MDEIQQRVEAFRSYALLFIGVAVGAIVMTLGGLAVLDATRSPNISIAMDSPAVVRVRIDGDVVTPGTYSLPADARLTDAIDAAGGLTADADANDINLSQRVSDGDEITVGSTQIHAETVETDTDGALLDLNSATREELIALPGIGEVRADQIIAYRTEHGSFTSVEQLRDLEGFPDDVVDGLLPLVTVESDD